MFSSIEFLTGNSQAFCDLLEGMGMKKKGQEHYQRGAINFILNCNPQNQAQSYFEKHGPSAFAVGLTLLNPQKIIEQNVLQVTPLIHHPLGYTHAVEWIGGTQLYIKQGNLEFDEGDIKGLDHISYNVYPEELDVWTHHFENLLGFEKIKSFHIEGQSTHLQSQAMISSCGKMRVTMNTSADPQSQIQEFLRNHKGSGIQHIAFMCTDILRTTSSYIEKSFPFLDIDSEYYEKNLKGRFEEQKDILKKNHIIVEEDDNTALLQAFSYPVLGNMFFELIERQGHAGFGNGNFTAAFKAFEDDQKRRGMF
jgi:4-hydroxyphenylpyruvate dioxygenase